MKPLLLFLLLAPTAYAVPLATLKQDARQHAALLDRIQRVETGGCKDPAHAVGDSGKARGWLQCHASYWADARRECPELPAYRTGATDRDTARLAVCAYWRRYGAKTDRERATCHHYGPAFRRVADKDKYAAKCGI